MADIGDGTAPWMETPADGTPNPPSNPGGLGGLGGYVSSLYQNMFNRTPGQSEIQPWVDSGLDKDALLKTFANSQEYRSNQIPLMYQSLTGRDADQQGADYWLNSGLSLANINSAIGNSQESSDYFSHLQPPSTGWATDDKQLWDALSMNGVGAGNRASGLLDYYTRAFNELGAKSPSLAASALLGQFGVESPGLIAGQREVLDGGVTGPGDGIAQWTFRPRKDALTAFRASHADMNPLEAEGRFALSELMTNPDYANSLKRLLNARDNNSAMTAALSYEQPGGWSEDSPTMANGYKERMLNLNALLSFAKNGNTESMTPSQMDAFMRMQGVDGKDARRNPLTAPMPTPRPDSLGGFDPMISVNPDPRQDLINSNFSQSYTPFTVDPAMTPLTTIGGYNGLNGAIIGAGYTVPGGYSSGLAPGVQPGGGVTGAGMNPYGTYDTGGFIPVPPLYSFPN